MNFSTETSKQSFPFRLPKVNPTLLPLAVVDTRNHRFGFCLIVRWLALVAFDEDPAVCNRSEMNCDIHFSPKYEALGEPHQLASHGIAFKMSRRQRSSVPPHFNSMIHRCDTTIYFAITRLVQLPSSQSRVSGCCSIPCVRVTKWRGCAAVAPGLCTALALQSLQDSSQRGPH